MANRYWVGGGSSANWNATAPTNWGTASNTQDNASVPTSTDDVIFDGVGTGASNSTISAAITINSLDCTGYANTLTHNNVLTLTIAGNLFKLSSGMTYVAAVNTCLILFTSTSGTTLITTAGKGIRTITFDGVGGTFQLQDALAGSSATASVLTLTNGTFDTNNFNVTWARFASNNSNIRTLTMGSSTFSLGGTNVTPWNLATTTNLTFNVGTSVITFTDILGFSKTFAGGGLQYATVTLGVDFIVISGNNTFNTLNVNMANLATGLQITSGSTQTIVNSFTTNGDSGIIVKLSATTPGSAFTLSKVSGIVCEDWMSIQDSTASGGAVWSAGANSTNVSGNSGWAFTACPGSVCIPTFAEIPTVPTLK